MGAQAWVDLDTPKKEPCEDGWWESLRALPTLPAALFRYLGLIGDSSVGTQDLADFIWTDPALLSRALPLVRFSDAGEGSGSLREAIASLGRAGLRRLAVSTPLLRSTDASRWGPFATALWERSQICAVACETAARHLRMAEPERFYVAGMLHDIGYIALFHERPSLLAAIRARLLNRPNGLLKIEQELFGLDHCRLGVEVAKKLGLSPWLYPAIAGHHRPVVDSGPLTKITSLGSLFCAVQGMDLFPRRRSMFRSTEGELHERVRVLFPA
jgi:HD-like signal output (HDOD) protein